MPSDSQTAAALWWAALELALIAVDALDAYGREIAPDWNPTGPGPAAGPLRFLEDIRALVALEARRRATTPPPPSASSERTITLLGYDEV